MENQSQLAEMLTEHGRWQQQILKYKDALSEMKETLGVLVAKHTPRDVPANAEHFQNQFILQRDVLDRMRHDFKQYENRIEEAQSSETSVPENLLQVRQAYQARLADYDKLFTELKSEFQAFKKADTIPA